MEYSQSDSSTITVLCDVTPRNTIDADVSEEPTVTIFRIEEHSTLKTETSRCSEKLVPV
jgi:hypothetical protein